MSDKASRSNITLYGPNLYIEIYIIHTDIYFIMMYIYKIFIYNFILWECMSVKIDTDIDINIDIDYIDRQLKGSHAIWDDSASHKSHRLTNNSSNTNIVSGMRNIHSSCWSEEFTWFPKQYRLLWLPFIASQKLKVNLHCWQNHVFCK